MKIERPYQTEDRRAIMAALEQHRSALYVLPTGCGKSLVACKVMEQWLDEGLGEILFLAHRDELIDQIAGTIEDEIGIRPEREKAQSEIDPIELRANGIAVGSIQTMRIDRLKRRDIKPNWFSLIIIDEAHRACGASYRRLVDYFGESRVLGLTATPFRTDKLGLKNVFDHVAAQRGLWDMVEAGWLARVQQRLVRCDELDFSGVTATYNNLGEKDYSPQQLSAIMREESLMHKACTHLVDTAGERSTLVFCVDVEHVKAVHHVIRRYLAKKGRDPELCQFVIGDKATISTDQRKEILDDFRAGRVQYLVNCQVLTEGVDVPRASVLAMMRPTQSKLLYLQAVGRVTRPLPGVVDSVPDNVHARKRAQAASAKPFATVYDYVGASLRHKSFTLIKALAGKIAPEVLEQVARDAHQRAAREDVELVLSQAVKRAQEQLKREEEEQKRRRHVVAKGRHREEDVSLYGGASNGKSNRGKPSWHSKVTDKQRGFLKKLGADDGVIAGLRNGRQASDLIDKLMHRPGSATKRQCGYLRHLGVSNPEKLSFSDASAMIEKLKAGSHA